MLEKHQVAGGLVFRLGQSGLFSATFAMTGCTQTSFSFADHCCRQVVARFDGGTISSDGGAVLLRQLEQGSGIVRQFAACFRDCRNPSRSNTACLS